MRRLQTGKMCNVAHLFCIYETTGKESKDAKY